MREHSADLVRRDDLPTGAQGFLGVSPGRFALVYSGIDSTLELGDHEGTERVSGLASPKGLDCCSVELNRHVSVWL